MAEGGGTVSESTNDGGPAYPRASFYHENIAGYDHKGYDGMTLRDYFAAAAVQGELAAQGGEDGYQYDAKHVDGLATWAFLVADAMLKARAGK